MPHLCFHTVLRSNLTSSDLDVRPAHPAVTSQMYVAFYRSPNATKPNLQTQVPLDISPPIVF